MRRLGLSLRPEEAYVGWVRRFILASGKRHPREMGAREGEAFLTLLATRDRVSASTQNPGCCALTLLVHVRGCGATLVVAELDRLAH
jgi:hypothetical protein